MRPTFDMDALRTMAVGTDLGSFARAASQLGRSQSAVSMQLKKLEEQAGQILFRRNGRGLERGVLAQAEIVVAGERQEPPPVALDPEIAARARLSVQRMIDLPPPAIPARYDLVKARHHVDVELI